jgi:hypothetical protein
MNRMESFLWNFSKTLVISSYVSSKLVLLRLATSLMSRELLRCLNRQRNKAMESIQEDHKDKEMVDIKVVVAIRVILIEISDQSLKIKTTTTALGYKLTMKKRKPFKMLLKNTQIRSKIVLRTTLKKLN